MITSSFKRREKCVEPKLRLQGIKSHNHIGYKADLQPEILFISSYPPRECGIATYSQDLILAIQNKFEKSFKISLCALESSDEKHDYTSDVRCRLNTDESAEFSKTVDEINRMDSIKLIVLQHEFGFFHRNQTAFLTFISSILKPIVTVFHTVLPNPDNLLYAHVQKISTASKAIIVMTNSSKEILAKDYDIEAEKISVIPHGTHLLPHTEKNLLKTKYGLQGRKILSTFGLLSAGKNIETTLKALPDIISSYPEVLFLIIGKTHPSVYKEEGDQYIHYLKNIIAETGLAYHVRFIQRYLPLPELLEYLQLTDIYLFTSNDPSQAVSGTFSYAISAGCPVVSTPIPHAKEIVGNDSGIIVDFSDSTKLSVAVNLLLSNDTLRTTISMNAIHKMASTAWENSAIAHAKLFERISGFQILLDYTLPPVNLNHFKKLTDNFGIIQFSKINQPDHDSGYTLDDNARALVAICRYYKTTYDPNCLRYLIIYYQFIKHCLQQDGSFLNYINKEGKFSMQNASSDLSDSNGRAIWALGYMISMKKVLPIKFNALCLQAESIFTCAISNADAIHSTRAISFVIKGLYYKYLKVQSLLDLALIRKLANRLIQMYHHESNKEWQWFESYMTYANSVMPEALLCAWLSTGETEYRDIAKTTFKFLLEKTFDRNQINLISNKNWPHREFDTLEKSTGGQQPIDVAYTIVALEKFYEVFKEDEYKEYMKTAFNWFLGQNHLQQVIYNPCTGGCYDGLESQNVNLNQGAESTISYLLARLTVEEYVLPSQSPILKENLETEKTKLGLISNYSLHEFQNSSLT